MNRQQQQIARKIRTEKLQNARIIEQNEIAEKLNSNVADFCTLWGQTQFVDAVAKIKEIGITVALEIDDMKISNAVTALLETIGWDENGDLVEPVNGFNHQQIWIDLQNLRNEIYRLGTGWPWGRVD